MRRALVLGGGGVIGVAWETGLLEGLAAGGVDVRSADLVVGTSAGSIVGTRVAAGHDVSQPATAAPAAGDAPSSVPLPVPDGGPDLALLGQVFELWGGTETMTQSRCAEIGALAAKAKTVAEEAWVASMASAVGIDDWPETPLRLTAVDVAEGRFQVHSRQSGASLHHAVAASCAIPGLFPPITLEGGRYMDGGVRSGTSADLALDLEPDFVLVIAPICARTANFGALAERSLAEEGERLRGAGAEVCAVLPDERDLAAFGPSLMDPGRADAARSAGRERGLALAVGEAETWRG